MPHYISVSIYLVACEQALLGVGGGRGKEDPPPRELARRLWGNWRCWRLSLLKDCRLYAPQSQIWPEYKLETASCYLCATVYSTPEYYKSKCCVCLAVSVFLGNGIKPSQRHLPSKLRATSILTCASTKRVWFTLRSVLPIL